MMKYFLAIALAVVISLALGTVLFKDRHITTKKETVGEKVLRANVIRCAYALRPPMVTKDINTGKLSGIGVDLTEEIGKRLNLKIDWAEEVGFGTIVESIKSGRVDMGCGIYWSNSARAPQISFTRPIYFESVHVYQRMNDNRRFQSYEELNSPDYSFSSIDGGTPILLQKQAFPLSRQKTLPELSDLAETLEDLTTKKVDFVIQPEITIANFERTQKNRIKPVLNRPLAYYPTVMFLPANDFQFKSMIDATLMEIEYDGTLERILKRYNVENIMRRNPMPEKFSGKYMLTN